MDFELTEEQAALGDAVANLLSRSYDPETRLKMVDSDLGFSRDVWQRLAELGALGLTFAESDGGAGAGPVEVMVVMEQLGRSQAPEPLLDAVILPGALVSWCGSEQQRREILPAVAAGTRLLAFAHEEPGTRWPDIEVATRAARDGTGYALTGVKSPVGHGDCAEQLVVSATVATGGLGLFLVDAAQESVVRKPYRTYDERRGAQVELRGAPAQRLGNTGGQERSDSGIGTETDASQAISDAIVTAQACLYAEAVGAMSQALELTTDYLKVRKQFGTTLSKFQALTHRAAQLYVALETARSMSYYATASLADGVTDPVVSARAGVAVGRSARLIAQEAIQMHGGIGMTAEYPVGHYAARLTAIDHTLGDRLGRLRMLADRIGQYDLVQL